ncbi:MAG TPA: GNAT family N-acetyltransferase [Gemmatimonadaceae bacterium]|nr:GNAT family N-acetyltransferase [Gemmatimonadaceae bacterium]
MTAPIVEVTHDAGGRRYAGTVEGERLATLRYSLRGDAMRLEHTEVDPRARGRGIGEAFVRQVLDELRAEGRRIAVTCPFVTKFIDRNPQYRDLTRPS